MASEDIRTDGGNLVATLSLRYAAPCHTVWGVLNVPGDDVRNFDLYLYVNDRMFDNVHRADDSFHTTAMARLPGRCIRTTTRVYHREVPGQDGGSFPPAILSVCG